MAIFRLLGRVGYQAAAIAFQAVVVRRTAAAASPSPQPRSSPTLTDRARYLGANAGQLADAAHNEALRRERDRLLAEERKIEQGILDDYQAQLLRAREEAERTDWDNVGPPKSPYEDAD